MNFEDAIRNGDFDAVEAFINNGASLSDRFPQPSDAEQFSLHPLYNPLDLAVASEHIEIVNLLIARHADVNARGGWQTALQEAVFRDNVCIIEILLKAGADVNAERGPELYNHFVYGGTGGYAPESPEEMERWESGHTSDFELQDRHETALSMAIRQAKKPIVRLLLDHGAELYRQALYDVAESGDEELFNLVFDHWLSVNLCDCPSSTSSRSQGQALKETPVEGEAASKLNIQYKSGDINAKSGRYGAPLQACLLSPKPSRVILHRLLDHGADINATEDKSGQTILALIAKGSADILRVLADRHIVESQSHPFLKWADFSPVHAAACHPNAEIMQLLLSGPAKRLIQEQDVFGRTPLYLACETAEAASRALTNALGKFWESLDRKLSPPSSPSATIIKLLIDHGARGDIADFGRITAFEVAIRNLSQDRETLLGIYRASPNHGLRATQWRSFHNNRSTLQILENDFGEASSELLKAYLFSKNSFDYERASLELNKKRIFLLGNAVDFDSFGSGLTCQWWQEKKTQGNLYTQRIQWLLVRELNTWDRQDDWISNQTFPVQSSSKIDVFVYRFITRCPLLPEFKEYEWPWLSTSPRSGTRLLLKHRTHAIQWLMKRLPTTSPAGNGALLDSVAFISTLDYGQLPQSFSHLLVPLAKTIQTEWAETLKNAEHHLTGVRMQILQARGDNHLIIDCLLNDALVWERLEKEALSQLQSLVELQDAFKPVSWDVAYDGAQMVEFKMCLESLSAHLQAKVKVLKDTSKELIGLEFNLVSISEAQKSTTMAKSMKRLTWITFVFLPLTFVAVGESFNDGFRANVTQSLFGMNVNLLANNPPWWTYLPFAAITLALTMSVWLIFKFNVHLEQRIEDGFTRLINWRRKPELKGFLSHRRSGSFSGTSAGS